MSQVSLYDGYRVCTDGSLKPAEIVLANNLVRHHKDQVLAILHKYGLEKIRDYRDYEGDFEGIVLIVRPDALELLKEMITEIAKENRKQNDENAKQSAEWQKARDAAQASLDKVVTELEKITEDDS
jgi:hypothetical protein